MSILQLAILFFIVTNPIGNAPTLISLVKEYPIKRQQKILFRESIFSMLLALLFLLGGEAFLSCLCIEEYALRISGGIILFLVALRMIFSRKDEDQNEISVRKVEPYIVPIATPLLSGAGLLSLIILYSKKENNTPKLFFSILLAWVGITTVLVLAPYLQYLFGKRGLSALEQLMGMLLAIISIEMMVQGLHLFLLHLGIS